MNRIKTDDDQPKTTLNINNQRKKVKKRGVGGGTKLTHNEFVERVNSVNEDIIILGEYVNSTTKVRCKCARCGDEWESLPDTLYETRQCKVCGKYRKRNRDDFIQKINTIHPTIEIIGEYVNSKTKVHCRCGICGFEWEVRPDVLYQTKGCLRCNGSHRRNRDEFIEDLSKINKTVEVVGKYVNTSTKVQCRCRICLAEWSADPHMLLLGRACPECGKKKRGGQKPRKKHNDFVSELLAIDPTIEVVGTYEKNSVPIKCRCKQCASEWDARPSDLLRGYGCHRCAVQKRSDAMRKTHEQFVAELAMINPQINVISEYISRHSKIDCRCTVCGNSWTTYPGSLLQGHGCPSCIKTQTSFVEKSIFLFLQRVLGEANVLPRNRSAIGKELDVYLPSLNTAIEFGSWYWHRSRVESDKKKYHLCNQNGIKLIVIYDSFDKDSSAFDFDEMNFITYTNDLGNPRNRKELKSLLLDIFKRLGLDYTFSDTEENEIFLAAKELARRKSHDEIVNDLKTVNPKIKLFE